MQASSSIPGMLPGAPTKNGLDPSSGSEYESTDHEGKSFRQFMGEEDNTPKKTANGKNYSESEPGVGESGLSPLEAEQSVGIDPGGNIETNNILEQMAPDTERVEAVDFEGLSREESAVASIDNIQEEFFGSSLDGANITPLERENAIVKPRPDLFSRSKNVPLALDQKLTKTENANLLTAGKESGSKVNEASMNTELLGKTSRRQTAQSQALLAESVLKSDASLGIKLERNESVLYTANTFNVNNTQIVQEQGRAQLPVTVHFSEREWGSQVAERAAMMAAHKVRFAELQLDPPELGSLQIKISVNSDNQTQVQFLSPHSSVRDSLDQTIVRLRDLLEQQGLDLVNVDVSDQQSTEQETPDNEERDKQAPGEDQAEQGDVRIAQYRVDYYI